MSSSQPVSEQEASEAVDNAVTAEDELDKNSESSRMSDANSPFAADSSEEKRDSRTDIIASLAAPLISSMVAEQRPPSVRSSASRLSRNLLLMAEARRRSSYMAAFPGSLFTIADEVEAQEILGFENTRFTATQGRPSIAMQSVPSRKSIEFYAARDERRQAQMRRSSLAEQLSRLEVTEQLVSSRFSLKVAAEVHKNNCQPGARRTGPPRRSLRWPDVGRLELGRLLQGADQLSLC